MKNPKKRVLALFLSLCLVFTLLPTMAFAAEGNVTDAKGGSVTDASTFVTALTSNGGSEAGAEIDSADSSNKTVKLTKDVTVTGSHIIVTGEVILDLNGKTLTLSGKVLSCSTGGTLTVRDSSANKNGKITGTGLKLNGLIFPQKTGRVIIEGGTIESTNEQSKLTICAQEDSDLTITGDAIINGFVEMRDNTTLQVTGGKITAPEGWSAVEVIGTAAAEITAGTLSTTPTGGSIVRVGPPRVGYTPNTPSFTIGGTAEVNGMIEVYDGATLNVTGGKINGSPRAIYTMDVADESAKAVINISDGVINGCVQMNSNSALYVTGGKITAPQGWGAVGVAVNAVAEITGGTLTSDEDNTVATTVGVGNSEPNKGNPTLTIGGNATIHGDIAVYDNATLNVNGGTINADFEPYAIATNGAAGVSYDAKINITGGTINGNKTGAGVYVPAGTWNISGGSITAGVAVLARGGTVYISEKAILSSNAEPNTTVKVGSDNHYVPVGALTVDHENYPETEKVTVSGGWLKGAVSFTQNGQTPENLDEAVGEKLKVTGGYFSNSVDSAYLDDSLTAELESKTVNGEDTPFSYYSSAVEAEKAAEAAGDTAAEVTPVEGKATIVAAGFIGTGVSVEDSNKILNNAIIEAFPGVTSPEITDSTDNVFWAIFKAAQADETKGQTYTVKFTKDGAESPTYYEAVSAKKGGIIYFTPGMGSFSTTEDFHGKYNVELFRGEALGSAVSSATIEVYQVKYTKGTGVKGEDVVVYTDKAGLDPAKNTRPDRFEFDGTNRWNTNSNSESEDGYTITVTISASYQPTGGGSVTPSATVKTENATNGSFSVSNKYAGAGKTVTVTPKADEGYVVDEVTVTDKNDETVEVTANEDGTYSFVMPEKAAQPVTVTVTFKCDGGEKCPTHGFTDVDQTEWYHEAVDYVVENKLMGGTGDATFEPDATTSRAMFVTILWRLEGEPEAEPSVFTDVPEGEWYSDAVAWAFENGIVNGSNETEFDPDGSVTREQVAAILYRYAAYKEFDLTAEAGLTGYTDAASVSEYATEAMNWAVATRLIGGTSKTTLDPTGDSTRAQIATILMRFCEEVAK